MTTWAMSERMDRIMCAVFWLLVVGLPVVEWWGR